MEDEIRMEVDEIDVVQIMHFIFATSKISSSAALLYSSSIDAHSCCLSQLPWYPSNSKKINPSRDRIIENAREPSS